MSEVEEWANLCCFESPYCLRYSPLRDSEHKNKVVRGKPVVVVALQ